MDTSMVQCIIDSCSLSPVLQNCEILTAQIYSTFGTIIEINLQNQKVFSWHNKTLQQKSYLIDIQVKII